MKRSMFFLLVLLAILSLVGPLQTVRAAIVATGNVDPADPTTWTSSTYGYVGKTRDGTLTVYSHSDLYSRWACIGYNSGVMGAVIVYGTGSTWTNTSFLRIGYHGSGTLNISGGGTVSSHSSLVGHGVVTVDGAGSMWTNSRELYVGSGTLNITNGAAVSNACGGIGRFSGSTGVVTVDGSGSTWTNYSDPAVAPDTLVVGCDGGNGTLNITGGGAVSNGDGYIGIWSGSTGVVTVDGTGSTWTNNDDLYVGAREGSGTLNISCGATVSAAGSTYVAYVPTQEDSSPGADSTGLINFGSGGGTLTTRTLYASPTHLTGTGTINARGLVSDIDLVFDSTHGLNQTLKFNSQPEQNVTINLDMSGGSGSTGYLGAGYKGNGSLTVQDGITVSSKYGCIGCGRGSTGVVTVEGNGSTWTNSEYLSVGDGFRGFGYDGGSGTLNITGGGAVSSNVWCCIGGEYGSTGVVIVDGTGSTLINSGYLFVGTCGSGTLNITNGAAVSNEEGGYGDLSIIGCVDGSTGIVTVDGTGSTWTNGVDLYVGFCGSGTLNITNCGAVSNASGCIGYEDTGTGQVTVDGAGSTWTNSDDLCVGYGGSGTLNVSGGGHVTGTDVWINSQSLLAIDVGNGSLLNIGGGSGVIDNDGTVRIVAGACATAGTTYAPISAGTWDGTGIYQALGGTWNETTHEFTVSVAEYGTSGTAIEIDLADKQRVMIEDSGTGWSVGVSFAATTSSTPLTLTPSAISDGTLTDLEDLLDAGQWVLGGWEFTATGGYTPGDPAYLSFGIDTGYSRDDLQIWHHDTTGWEEYAPGDLTYDGTCASFTVTGFSGYALTLVPEPGTIALSAVLGLIGLLLYIRRRRSP